MARASAPVQSWRKDDVAGAVKTACDVAAMVKRVLLEARRSAEQDVERSSKNLLTIDDRSFCIVLPNGTSADLSHTRWTRCARRNMRTAKNIKFDPHSIGIWHKPFNENKHLAGNSIGNRSMNTLENSQPDVGGKDDYA